MLERPCLGTRMCNRILQQLHQYDRTRNYSNEIPPVIIIWEHCGLYRIRVHVFCQRWSGFCVHLPCFCAWVLSVYSHGVVRFDHVVRIKVELISTCVIPTSWRGIRVKYWRNVKIKVKVRKYHAMSCTFSWITASWSTSQVCTRVCNEPSPFAEEGDITSSELRVTSLDYSKSVVIE